ncbi:amino acid adenylation domain-containing protein [Methylobacter sp. S3L5C]|uniref:non-ribosomal peptide synthetase n=1 Tax=Methylobacter sp. S3L5C TaxID=2839024 RepID=UPI001FAB6AEE|nr:amino acid adenylation domain-containing protein [Methylobacter sp. S3L5C]UOA07970.1 amino acid adenylation domain-containing protein [Methylobacter sp. S3L5C]
MLEKQLSYWKNQLFGLGLLELPTDKPRPKQLSYRSAKETFQLSPALTKDLKTVSQKQNASLFMILLAALLVLLHRYSGQDDIVVGTAITDHNDQGAENPTGLFVNMLALRTDLSGTLSFYQLLSRVQEVCLSAYAHQDLPFEKLVEQLQVPQNTNRHPLFQIMLVLQDSALPGLQLPDLVVNNFTSGNEMTGFDIAILLAEDANGLTANLEYSTDLFNAETIVRLVGHFKILLAAVVEHPEAAIAHLPLLTASELQQLLIDWNATQTDYPKNKCVHQLFEEQVARTPDAIALVYAEQQLSYQMLNAQANQLAHYLQTAGVKVDTLVLICMERSVGLVVGLLAILKAGGAYVPMDPNYPRDALTFMLEDINAPVLLTHSSLLAQLPAYSGQCFCLDNCRDEINRESAENLGCNTTAENLAYVIYTSGSTGRPKGVAICHYNIARLLLNTDYVHFDDQQTFLLLAPITFDASTFEIWGSLLHGARCVIYAERIPSLHGLETIIQQQKISILWLTAALFNAVIDEKPQILRSVAQILTGGEALSVAHIQRAVKLLPDSQLINGYGPTESTTFACCYPIPKTIPPLATSIPIGYPIANTRIYILDRHLQPVPIGVSGEIHIGGDGLARDYLNRPELTAEKFIADPFCEYGQARLYKTGDLARYLPDGAIEFLGRTDYQIKLRGFRIEPGEIEYVLGQHPDINGAIVIVRDDSSGYKHLVAYLTYSQDKLPNINALRLFLTRKLPKYMVPTAFVLLDKLPLTPNGKVNRAALPAPELIHTAFDPSYVASHTPMEAMLVAMWCGILKINSIGIEDDFFALGGHSLLAIVLSTKIEAKIGKLVPVEWIYQYPTISQLADILTQPIGSDSKKIDSIITGFQIDGTQPPLFWGLHGGPVVPMILEHLGANQPLYLLNHQALDGVEAKHVTILEIANYYLQNIQKIDPDGPYYLGGFSIGGTIIYEIARQLCAQGKHVALLFILDPSGIGYDDTDEDYLKQKITLSNEYKNLKRAGSMAYFKNHVRKQLLPIIIKTYFSLNIALPARFHWFYMLSIYRSANQGYQHRFVQDGMENAIIVHTSHREMDDWIAVFNGIVRIYRIDCWHMELLELPYRLTWLKILSQVIKEANDKPL